MARQRMGRAARSGNGAGGLKSGTLQPRLQVIAQHFFAAEEMWHPRNIGHQPIGPIRRHHRRVAAGPPPQAGQGRCLTHEIGGTGGKVRADSAGICERHSPRQAPGAGGLVQAMQMIGIARRMGQGKRPVKGPCPEARVAREPRKPYGQQATRHSSSQPRFHLFPFCSH